MIYKTYDQVLKADLKLDDYIIFTFKGEEYAYKIHPKYLEIYPQIKYNNDTIFRVLGYDYDEIHELGEKIYGYEIVQGTYFPEYKYKDFKALKKMVLFLYKKCGDCFTNLEELWE